ncbi:RNA polymerase II degradation factor 1 isoform X2 [Drosophila busckii]|uniref:RNA polymerase II degradation factor 1 isoform X2 n=1 Tax=Drosophila busckii TaxID=30019 RepID=UPI00083EABD5|nr:RNA polymerase II degradation factor 1 isoform X2 [Drosophila busckii]
MDTHGVKRAAEPNAYEHLAKRVYRPSPTAARGEQEDTTKPEAMPNMEPGPSAAATTEFLTEVLGALYGDTTGHPENGSFSYFKAAENYALASANDGHSKSHVPTASYATVAAKAQPAPPGFERSAKALYERRQASSASSSTAKPSARTGSATATYKPQTKQQCLNAGGDASGCGGSQRQHGNASMNDLSQMYLQLLQQSLPHQQLQQQQHNLSMYNNDIANVYAQLLAVNLRQNHQQQQQQQQTTNTAAAAAILYEAMLQQRARALQQQQQQQHQQLQQQQQQQQQQQARNTPRGIYGNNFASSSLSKTPTPENKPN